MRLLILIAGAALALAPSAGLAQQHAAPKSAPPAPQAAPQATAPVQQAFDPKVARRITADEVKKRMDAGDKIIIIDTRSKFTGPMVKGAKHVPGDQLDAWAKDVPKDTFILAYCT
jgi:hypothetical protein